MTIRKILNADGTATIFGRDGEPYYVPSYIQLIKEPEIGFKKSVRDQVEDAVEGALGDMTATMSAIRSEKFGFLKVMYSTGGSRLDAMLVDLEGKSVGWAEYARKEGRLEERLAAIHSSYQGKGVYIALLRLLKTEVSPIILSDQTLSVKNALQWLRHGAPSPEHKRIRLNPARPSRRRGPRPTRRDIERAVLSIYIREATR